MDPQSDEKVANLLGGLKRVNAPENFESRVKARLSVSPLPYSNFGFLKLAVPTAALAVLALFLFLSGYIGGDLPKVDVAEQAPPASVSDSKAGRNAVLPNNAPQPAKEFRSDDVATVQPPPVNVKPAPPKSQKNINRGGSYDEGYSPDKPIMGPGFNTNQRAVTNSASEKEMRRPGVPASQLLSYTGTVIEFRSNEWVVNSVVQKSPAERIGLKAGDVVVALNEMPLARSTVFPSGVDLKTIRVRRGSNSLVLKF
jgi:hypothetical protein